MLLIITIAYNAEKTLSKTIESVLSQTHGNFVYHILNNGSTDGTADIMSDYAKKDSRIFAGTRKQNGIAAEDEKSQAPRRRYNNFSGDGILCYLDADDEYKPEFLEKMLEFMEKYNLDVAACGNDFINVPTNQLYEVRCLPDDLILGNGVKFNKHFPTYYQFMRTVWGKLYRFSTWRKRYIDNEGTTDIPNTSPYGRDTLLTMKAFEQAQRVGILSESLHKYYVSPQTVSHKFDERRLLSPQILHDEATKFLINKTGKISAENREFLFRIYAHHVIDAVTVLLNSQADITIKLSGLVEVFSSNHTQQLRAGGMEEKYQMLTNHIAPFVNDLEKSNKKNALAHLHLEKLKQLLI